jgi:1,2-diacylglycerol 3-alpha-glucosyltransferase
MKIAFFTNSYRPLMYGSSNSVENFRIGLEKLGHEVYVFAPKFWGYKQENKKVIEYPSIMYGYKIKYPLPFAWNPAIIRKAEKMGFDVVHSHHPFSMGMEAMRLAKKISAPLILTHHARYDDYSHYILPILPQGFIKKTIRKKVSNYANKCNRVIAPSHSILEYIRNNNINTKIDVLSTGIDWNRFQGGDRIKTRKKHNIRSDQKVILNLGRLDQEKNLDFLSDIVFEILQKSDEYIFMLVGEGSSVEDIKDQAKRQKVIDKVVFTGLVDQKNVQDYYRAADVFVCASETETQGMTITEAKAAGLAIVALDATGISDQIEDQDTGFLIKNSKEDFKTKLEMILTDDQKREEVGKRARESAKDMDYLAQAAKLEEIYLLELKK